MRSSKAPAALLVGFALGCSGDPEPEPRVWVGEIVDTDVKVALADKGGGAMVLFFCGGDDSYVTSTRWFLEGVLRAQPFSFTEGDWRVEGAIEASLARGSVSSDLFPSRSWAATSIDSSTIAGLYEGSAPCGKLGLIVTQPSPKAEPRGQGACLRVEDGRAVVEQVNPIRLAEKSFTREIAVTVASAPEQEFTVRPVAAAAQ
jgi:hypothetical protein